MNFYIETLGCSKNQVDSETMITNLKKAGFFLTHDPLNADLIVINTCSFTENAIKESVETILESSALKKDNNCKQIIVTGCLPERFKEKIVREFPEVDFFLGTGSFEKIATFTKTSIIDNRYFFPDPNNVTSSNLIAQNLNFPHTAYLKIAEGCNRKCTYCIIPKLRGKQKSRSIYEIIPEAEKLIESGVKEIVLVAQDTTNYGRDLSEKTRLDTLLSHLSGLSKDIWIRFMYGNPDTIDKAIIKVVAMNNNLCSYFDLPIQHISENVLKNMGRLSKKQSLIKLFEYIKNCIETVALRTTLITGFPGETHDNFLELLDFLDYIKFDYMGVFNYSDAEDLTSHILPNHVDNVTANSRRNKLLSKQVGISRENLNRFMGKTIDILIESMPEKNLYEGRSMMQAPEVDGITYVHNLQGSRLKIGSIVPVKIIDSLEYDLVGNYNG